MSFLVYPVPVGCDRLSLNYAGLEKAGPVMATRRAMLHRAYKGKEYKAWLTHKGTISVVGKRYTSPSGAGKAVVRHNVNGWTFWYIKYSNGNWVRQQEIAG